MKRYPNLFLVGAPKCGTTSMAYYLGQHPEIFAPVAKEPVYFGRDLTRPGRGMDENQYFKLYKSWQREKYALDASTAYFVSISTAQEIYDVCPGAKIVIMIRNPVEAIHSLYFQHRFTKNETCNTFEAALEDQERRETLTSAFSNCVLEQQLYYRVYSYKTNIERYTSRFGNENVKLVLLDDLERNPGEVMRYITSFLNLEPIFDQKFPKKNISKKTFLPGVYHLLFKPPGWMGYFTKWWLPQNARIRIRQKLAQLTIMPDQYPPMRSETRQMLLRKFTPEIEALSKIVDRDLTHWLLTDE